jgi:hypothetical protein
MPRQTMTSEDELFALCDEIQSIGGKVTAARLREAAGGGGHNRLKAVVEAWQERRRETAKPTENKVQEKAGRGKSQDSKFQGRGRGLGRHAKAPARGEASPGGGKTAAESVTLEDVEQAEIGMEAGRVKVALSGGEATKTETPGEPDGPSSIEQAEADVSEALETLAEQQSGDALASETEPDTFRQSSTQPPAVTAGTPVSAALTSSASVPPAAGADAEIARLQAHVEDLRRENGLLWDQVRQEREARIREIELLNGMIQGMRR